MAYSYYKKAIDQVKSKRWVDAADNVVLSVYIESGKKPKVNINLAKYIEERHAKLKNEYRGPETNQVKDDRARETIEQACKYVRLENHIPEKEAWQG